VSASTTTTSLQPGVPLRPAGADYGSDPDGMDSKRVQLVRRAWSELDDLVQPQNRQIEENIRMLSGQQHAFFHPVLGRWLDVADWMSASERRWRTRAKMNRLLPWFMITHARATENTPIVTFLPGPDAEDAELAELLDIACKAVWWEANMEDVHDRVMGWVIAGGRGHLFTRIDPTKGKLRDWVGEDMVPLVDPYDQPVDDGDGGQAQVMAQGVRFDKDGKPLSRARLVAPGQTELVHDGEAHQTPIGQLVVDVLSPMQVRGSWGPTPWHEKPRHIIRSYHPVEDIYDRFQVMVDPTVRGGAVSDIGELERLLYGTGFFGAVEGLPSQQQGTTTNTEGYVELTQLWEAPCTYGETARTGDSPGGRWLVCTPDRVLRDGPRPAAFPYTSPLSTFEFIRIPGRPGGTTPQEALNPIQRGYNDTHSRIKDHVNLCTNPKALIDTGSGIKEKTWTNAPAENHYVNRRPNVPAVEYVAPPRLGPEVAQLLGLYKQEFDDIGFMQGAQDPGAPGYSGEKLKEARFNTDRFLGPTMRRTAGEYGRMYETWRIMFPMIWDMETTLDYVGDDNLGRTLVVLPEIFEAGKVHVRPDVESMLPEGRGEKQAFVRQTWLEGGFGLPQSPEALKKYWESIAMPHLSRIAKPGGIDGTMAEQENGQLLQGVPADSIPVYEWYDDAVHLMTHERFMKSPEFRKLPPPIQDAFALHRAAHQFNASQKLQKAVAQRGALQSQIMGGPPGGGSPGGGPPASGGPPGTPTTPGVNPDLPQNSPSGRPALPAPPRGMAQNNLPTVQNG